jgi:hypothetical protein
MKQSCLINIQKHENVRISSQAINNQALLVFNF